MNIHEELLKILHDKGIHDSDEYRLKISRMDMMSELTLIGFSKEEIDSELEKLCANGAMAMDEVNIYEYDEPL